MVSFVASLPWIDERDARAFLAGVADDVAGLATSGPPRCERTVAPGRAPLLAAWLVRQQMGNPAFGSVPDDVRGAIRSTVLSIAASNAARLLALERIERAFAEAGLDLVLLKGAALAQTVYADPARRPMADLDLCVGAGGIDRAERILGALGYRRFTDDAKGDEVPLVGPRRVDGLLELHRTPFPGRWTRRAARPDVAAVLARSLPLGPGRHARRLSPEDSVIHVAVRLATSQFDGAPARCLLDLALIARREAPDWRLLAARAREYGLATLTWTVLDRADRLFRLPGCEEALRALRPGAPRRFALERLVSGEAVLRARDLTGGASRLGLLALLVDEPLRTAGRALRMGRE